SEPRTSGRSSATSIRCSRWPKTRSSGYVERPDSPHLELKSFLLNNRTDPKILFSGHRGSGKSTALNRLASDSEIRQRFFVVQLSIKDELNVADLTYTDLLVAMGHRLYIEAEKRLLLDDKLKRDLDGWSAELTASRTTSASAELKVEGWYGVNPIVHELIGV